MRKILFNNNGQGLVEYMVLVALIVAGSIGVLRVVGNNVATQYENINRSLGAGPSNALQLQNTDSSLLRKRDLTDFVQGTR